MKGRTIEGSSTASSSTDGTTGGTDTAPNDATKGEKMKTTFTPRYWNVGQHNGADRPSIYALPTNVKICTLEKWITDPAVDEMNANARLIAASPDLLDALIACVKAYEEYRDGQFTGKLWPDPNHIFHARAAIARATDGA